MKNCFLPLLWIGLLSAAACTPGSVQTPLATSAPPPNGLSIRGVFEGITPCSALARPLPQIPAGTDCEQMIWKVVLYQDSLTGDPATYALESSYGVPQPNTTGLAGGGTAIRLEGKWAVTKGTGTDPEAEVYQLYTSDSQVAVSLLNVHDDLLHILNQDQMMMVGNGAWSYTINRTDNQTSSALDGPPNPGPESTRPPVPEMPPGSSVLGVFEGRLPCHEIVFELVNITPYPNCAKIKSKLTLYQDQATGAPNTYLYMGTSTIREGTWSILQGMKDDPDAVVYQLHLEGFPEPAYFWKVDENHLFLLDRALNPLVGDALFSYTLSRTDKNTR